MATYNSLFSLGGGKVKELSAFLYDDTGKLSTSLNIEVTGSSGISITGTGGLKVKSGQSTALTDVATGSVDNDKIATKGYVDAQVGSGQSTQTFPMAATSGFAVGQAVAIGGTASNPLVLADADADKSSNAIGIIKSIATNASITVQLDCGIVVSSDLSALSVGDEVFVSSTGGALVPYSGVGSGKYITRVGFVSVPGTGSGDSEISIHCQPFGTKA